MEMLVRPEQICFLAAGSGDVGDIPLFYFRAPRDLQSRTTQLSELVPPVAPFLRKTPFD